MITSQDVAKAANVSQATVSRAFREDVYINPETRKRVLEVARQMGYFPNYSARSLKQQKSGIIGLMMADADNPFYASLTKSIEKFVNAGGYRLMITYNNEDPAKERECLESLISTQVEGAFCIPVSTQNRDLINVLNNNGVAVVQMIRKLYKDLYTVTINDEMGAYIATKYLLNHGHRDIIITEYGFNEKSPVKTAGYKRAMEEFELSVEDEHILDLPFGIDSAGLIAGAIAGQSATALITSNLPMTLSALKACKQHNLQIPEDISIIAYDDSEWLDFLGITAITHPMEEIGQNMSRALFEALNAKKEGGPDKTPCIEVKPYLLLRNSIKNLSD